MELEVALGYEVGPGPARPVDIPIGHMVVTGMTQQAGKTTTLEALIQRSGLRAVTFVTKRGERAFTGGRRMQPFFRERADWVFVASLIDATLGEKNKMLRAWLMKACRGTKTLAEVQKNVREAKDKARGFAESIYTEIDGYLDLVVPQLKLLPPVRKVEIGDGLNVMDLSQYSTELQALCIKSVLEHVYEHETGVITVIPEAWEFLPEGRGSPVKREAENLIRKGAGLKNFMWIDSQDLAGVWKLAVRAAPVYLIGVQREANEITRTLKNIPGGIAKPKATDIAMLEKGQFFACHGRHCVKTYVRPTWCSDLDAQFIAQGIKKFAPQPLPVISAAKASDLVHRGPPAEVTLTDRFDVALDVPIKDEPEEDDPMTPEQEQKLDRVIDLLQRDAAARPQRDGEPPAGFDMKVQQVPVDEDALFARFKARLLKDTTVLRVLNAQSHIELEDSITPVKVDGKSIRGLLCKLILEGMFDGGLTPGGACTEIKRRGKDAIASNVARDMNWLAAEGFLTREGGSDGYKAAPGMKKHIER